MRYINFLRSLALGFTFLSIAFAGVAQPTFIIQNVKGSCEGLPNGSFEILVTSGTGVISVSYFGPPTVTGIPATVGTPVLISNLPGSLFPGKTYIVVVQDEITSVSTNVTIINSPDPLSRSIDLAVNNSSCVTPNGSIDITPSGGSATPTYIYSWVGPGGFTATTQDISGLSGGDYTLTLSEANTNCSRVFPPILITDPSPLIFNITNPVTTPVCVGDDLTLNLSGSEVGVPYEVIQNGNPSGIIQIGAGGALSFVIPSGNFVDGDNFTIRGSNGFCTPADMNGFVVADRINITLTASITNNSSCVAFNGAIDLSVSGSAGPFLYNWSGPNGFSASTQDISGLEDGTYTIDVTDQPSNCVITANFIVGDDTPVLTATAVTSDNSRCITPFNGAIDLTIAGTTGPFTVGWTGPNGFIASTEDITTLETGAYQVTITDDNSGCFIVENFNVGDATPTITLSSVVTDNSLCLAPFNGSIDLTVTGSVGPFTFAWTGPSGFIANTEDITSLVEGIYNVLVTDDGSGCTENVSITVNNTAPTIILSTVLTDNSRCIVPFNGAIDLTVAGTAGPFTFDWSGPGGPYTTEDLANLEDGNYSVLVTDLSTGCTATTNVTINNVAPTLTLSTIVTDNSRCSAPLNGAIDLSVAGSAGPFTFDWSGPGGPYFSEDLINLQPGNYSVLVTEILSGCTVTTSVTINDVAPTLSLSTTVTDNTRCIAPLNGAIDLLVSGSVGPFLFDWTGPNGFTASTEDITNLEAGIYTIVVTDVPSGCIISSNISVGSTEVIPSIVSSTVIDNDRCSTPFNGEILITVSPVGSYTYQWIGPNGFTSSDEDISALESGVYSVTVTNTLTDCSVVGNFNVANTAPVLTVAADAILDNSSCAVPFTGAISITASPAGSYDYLWMGPNGFTSSNEDITSLEQGDYMVTVTNTALGCSVSAVFTVGDNTSTITIASQTIVDNTKCLPPFNGSITITAGGTPGPFTFDWTGPFGYTGTGSVITDLRSGDYSILIEDQTNGCTDTYTLTVGDNTPPVVVTLDSSVPNTACSAPFTGALNISVSGTPGPFIFDWNGPNGFTSSNEDITALVDGDYDVTVTDTGLGCQTTITFSVADNTPIVTVSVNNITSNTNCLAPFNGSITVSGGGTAGPFDFSWTGPNGFIGSGSTITDLESGDYEVTAEDQVLGCITTQLISVPNALPVISITQNVTANSNCLAPFNGAIEITSVSGTAGPFDFEWTGPNGFVSTSEDITGLEPGDYTVTVRDVNIGCSNSFVVTVPQNATTVAITLVTAVANDRCTGPFNGALDVTIGGTPGPYNIMWTGPSGFTAATEDISAVEHGSYTVSVEDVLLGCTNSATFVVPNATVGCGGLNCFAFAITVVDTLTQRPSCSNQNDGVITLNVAGVTSGNYIIRLISSSVTLTQTGPSGTYVFSGLSPDTYEYYVEDAVGNICQQPYNLPLESSIIASASDFVDVECFGSPTGQATFAIVSGGNSPYEYSLDGAIWKSFLSGVPVTDLPPNGTYPVLIRDNAADLCPYIVSVTINNINPAITIAFDTQDATCGNSDGSIFITTAPTGGTGGPYTYLLDGNPSIPVNDAFANLFGGNHVVTVIDNSGCEHEFNVVVPYPDLIAIAALNSTDASCNELGNITILIDNFIPAAQYEVAITNSISTVPTEYFTQYYLGNGLVSITELSRGNYFVWLKTTSAQCPTLVNALINNDPIILAGPIPLSFDFSCRYSNGDLQLINVSGASGLPYQYEVFGNGFLAQGSFTPDALGNAIISGFVSGQYSVNITQNQTSIGGCSTAQTGFSNAPLASLDTISVTVPAPSNKLELSFPEKGTASRLVKIQESGIGDYEIRLELVDPFGAADQSPVRDWQIVPNQEIRYDNLFAGNYILSLRDGYGCQKNYDLTIEMFTGIWIPNIFTPNNDGSNDSFYIRNLPASGSKLIVTNRWGTQVYSSSNYKSEIVDGVPVGDWSGNDVSDGVYYYKLEADGESFTGWVEVLRGQKP